MSKEQRLELTWIGKDTRLKLEPRIRLEHPAMSFAERLTQLNARAIEKMRSLLGRDTLKCLPGTGTKQGIAK